MRIEIRGDTAIIDGYVNAVARDSRELTDTQKGKFVEQIMPKTWERACRKGKEIRLLFNHQKNRLLGSTTDGTLELYEDNIGLRAICQVRDQEVIDKAKRGALTGWSFGFMAEKDSWEPVREGLQRRYVEEMDVSEISILDITPAYYGTSISMRADDEQDYEERNELTEIRTIDATKVEVDYSIQQEEIKLLKIGRIK